MDLVVAVARDGVDAYDGDATITIAPTEGFAAAPVTLARAASTVPFTIATLPARRHGAVVLQIRAVSADASASGELAVPLVVRGRPGALDTSFGDQGVFALGAAGAEATGLVVQADGSVLLGGRIGADVAVVRLAPDGRVDPTFGDAGTARVAVPDLASTHGLAVGASGSIVVGGNTTRGALLARFTRAGVVDTSFGAQGLLVLDRQVASGALALVEGNVYLGGRSGVAVDADAMQVLRVRPDGALEPGWATAGEALLRAPAGACTGAGSACAVTALSAKGDGRLTACSSRADGVNVRELFASGADDRNYDLVLPRDVLAQCSALANNTPLDVFVAGARSDGSLTALHLAVPPAGGPLAVDSRFPPFAMPAGAGLGAATGLVLTPNLLVVSANTDASGGPSRMALVRISFVPPKLDTTFGDGAGFVTTAVGASAAFSRTLALDSVGRVIVAGTNGDLVAVRYWL